MGPGLTKKATAYRANKRRLSRRTEKRNQSSNKSSHGSVGSIRDEQARRERQHILTSWANVPGGERLTRELNHRLRNIFSIILTILKQTAAHYPEAAEYHRALERRLRALSAATGLLDRNECEAVSISELIRLELAPFQDGHNVMVSGPDVSIRRVYAQDLAIVLHELTTNAAKYGALNDLSGTLSVTWRLSPDADDNNCLNLEWVERREHGIEPPQDSGFGMAVVRQSGSFFGGTASVEFEPQGLRYQLSIPANRLHGIDPPST